MRLGWVPPQNEIGTDPDDIGRWAQAVEELGFSYLDIFDHVLGADTAERPDWSGTYTIDHKFHEPFVLYGFLAAMTNLELATGVLVLPQRQTALVAKQAAELDLPSRGRLRLGVGIGWNHVESDALGLPFAAWAPRAARDEEQIGVLRQLWTERVVTVRGDHHRFDRAGIAPLPEQRPIPIWMGGGVTRPVLERVGRLADGWIAHAPRADENFGAAVATIRQAAERSGRDPRGVGLQGRIDIHGTLDRTRLQQAYERWLVAGVDHLSIRAVGQGRGRAAQLDIVHRVAELPRDELAAPVVNQRASVRHYPPPDV